MDNSSTQDSDASRNVGELKALQQSEPIASFLRMELVELSPGYAKVSMSLLPEYLNFNGFVFGGIIMALADEAFAYATNSVARPSIASQFNIHFIAAAKPNDRLFAECRVIRDGRRVGISEMTVTDQDGRLIARATGTTIPVR